MLKPTTRAGVAGHARRALLLALGAALVGGCLGEPKLEDRWTRLDLKGGNMVPYQSLAPGTVQPISVRATVTYRRIVTGFMVVELRASGTLSPASVTVHPDAPRLPMAQDIDMVLANSVTAGRATRAVTGWDHLIQQIDFAFDGVVPTVVDTATGGGPTGLFLLCYLGSGDEIERQDGTDTLIVTPFPSTPYQLLPIGMEFAVSGPRNQ